MDDRTLSHAGAQDALRGLDGIARHDWTRPEIQALFELPFPDLIFHAQRIHRLHFDPREVQISTLLSIKTGGCPEDCAYCPQSARYDTGVDAEKLMSLDSVLTEARAARSAGASRFCMGAAWRSPKDRELDQVCAMVEGVKALGLETCATLGMLEPTQAQALKDAGLDYYNHNLDTSPEYYSQIITTRRGLRTGRTWTSSIGSQPVRRARAMLRRNEIRRPAEASSTRRVRRVGHRSSAVSSQRPSRAR